MASHGGGGGLFALALASFARRSWTRFAARASASFSLCFTGSAALATSRRYFAAAPLDAHFRVATDEQGARRRSRRATALGNGVVSYR